MWEKVKGQHRWEYYMSETIDRGGKDASWDVPKKGDDASPIDADKSLIAPYQFELLKILEDEGLVGYREDAQIE